MTHLVAAHGVQNVRVHLQVRDRPVEHFPGHRPHLVEVARVERQPVAVLPGQVADFSQRFPGKRQVVPVLLGDQRVLQVREDLGGHAEEADAVPLVPLDDRLQVGQVLQPESGGQNPVRESGQSKPQL